MSDQTTKQGSNTASALKRGAEAAANGFYQATSFVARNDGSVADGAQAVTRAVGAGLDKVGDGLSVAGKRASSALHGNANRAGDALRSAIVGNGPVSGWRRAAGGLGWLVGWPVHHPYCRPGGGSQVDKCFL